MKIIIYTLVTVLITGSIGTATVNAASPKDTCANMDISGAFYHQNKPQFKDKDGFEDILRYPIFRNPPAGLQFSGYNIYMPTLEYPQQDLLACGYLDVTKPPFNADPSGNTGSASNNVTAFYEALKAGREYMLAVYVPEGTYYINDKIECIMGYDGEHFPSVDEHGACVLFGSKTGASRPVIKLTSNASGYGNASKPKNMIHFWARGRHGINVSQTDVMYNSGIVGLDFDTNGRPGARAINAASAQGSFLQDITVTATGSHTGILGVPGSAGGVSSNIRVDGGQYGIDLLTRALSYSQSPVLVGLQLHGQTKHAVLYGQAEAATLFGVEITVPANSTGPAIYNDGNWSPTNGSMNIIDSQISFDAQNANNVAVETNRGLYMRNTYVENANKIVDTADGDTLSGKQNGWRKVNEYATTSKPNYDGWSFPLIIDGARTNNDYVDFGGDNIAPPADLRTRHLYDEAAFPTFETEGAINIKLPPYNAKGDMATDDYAAIQQAIDDGHEVIFFPKGVYSSTRTINLRPNTKLIGAARHISLIMPKDDGSGYFTTQASPNPLVRSANSKDGTAALGKLQLHSLTKFNGASLLHWRTGRNSVINTINTQRKRYGGHGYLQAPVLLWSDHGGGKVYGQYKRDSQIADSTKYHWLKIDGTREPLTFYVNDTTTFWKWPKKYVRTMINNAQNVTTIGATDESFEMQYLIKDSKYINLYSTGDMNTGEMYGYVVGVENSTDFRLTGMMRRYGSRFFDKNKHDRFPLLHETLPNKSTFETSVAPFEHPILYTRGPLWDTKSLLPILSTSTLTKPDPFCCSLTQ